MMIRLVSVCRKSVTGETNIARETWRTTTASWTRRLERTVPLGHCRLSFSVLSERTVNWTRNLNGKVRFDGHLSLRLTWWPTVHKSCFDRFLFCFYIGIYPELYVCFLLNKCFLVIPHAQSSICPDSPRARSVISSLSLSPISASSLHFLSLSFCLAPKPHSDFSPHQSSLGYGRHL